MLKYNQQMMSENLKPDAGCWYINMQGAAPVAVNTHCMAAGSKLPNGGAQADWR